MSPQAAPVRRAACALAVAAALGSAHGCAARTPGGALPDRGAALEIHALAFRFLISRHPRAGRFELQVEGRPPDPRVVARLAAHDEIEALDERTVAVTPSAFRPGFEPGRTVAVALGAVEERPDAAFAIVGTHGAAGETPRSCPMTFVPRSGVWGLTRAGAAGCRLAVDRRPRVSGGPRRSAPPRRGRPSGRR